MGKDKCATHPPPSNTPTYQTSPTHMTAVIKIATLNINGITTKTRVGMMTEYTRLHDLDIVFIQEITSTELLNMP